MKRPLIGLLLLLGGSAGHAQRCECLPPNGRLPDDENAFEARYFKWSPRSNTRLEPRAAVQQTIAAVDSVVREHFNAALENQLRGRTSDLGTGRKLVEAGRHALFLCQLDSLHQRLESRRDRLDDRGVPSLKPVFQAYLNSLKMYRSQCRNLVEWENRLSGSPYQPGRPRAPRAWFVPVHEGNIDDFNQAYQFMELCKNNLLKEFSVLELTRKAEGLNSQVEALARQVGALTDCLNLVLENQRTLLKQTARDSSGIKPARPDAGALAAGPGGPARRRRGRSGP